jgi:hypothetical protein
VSRRATYPRALVIRFRKGERRPLALPLVKRFE